MVGQLGLGDGRGVRKTVNPRVSLYPQQVYRRGGPGAMLCSC